MKGIQTKYGLAVLSLLLLYSACSKDNGTPVGTPVIDSIQPKYTENGKDIYLYVKNLNSPGSENKVSVGGVEANVSQMGAGILKTTVPPGTFTLDRLTAEVKVNSSGQTATAFVYSVLCPRILSFSPEKVSPGQILTIKGLNFVADKNKTEVFFERLAGSSITAEIIYIDTEKVQVKVPENAASGTLYMLIKLADGPSSVLVLLPNKKITVL
eukprot:gene10513-12236_t